MKKLYIIWFVILACVINQNANSQNIGDLNGIYYQAVAIDENGKEIVGMDIEGKPLYEKAIGVRFTITKGLNGAIEWEETHTTTTDKYGLFSLTIGLGLQTGNGLYSNMLDIPWIDADQFLKVELSTKNDGNYVMVSNQRFMSVPYSFYADDIADNAITTAKILNEAILSEDIATDAVTTSEILDSTITNQDIKDGAIDTRTILDGAIVNEDIADSTINLSTKVTDSLSVANGGTGKTFLTDESLLVGSGIDPVKAKVLASSDASVIITQTADTINLQAVSTPTVVTSDPAGTFVIGNLPNGTTYTSNAINAFVVSYGDVIIGSIDVSLQGCMLTAYVSQPNVIRISIYNGTGGAVNLGTVNVKVLIVH